MENMTEKITQIIKEEKYEGNIYKETYKKKLERKQKGKYKRKIITNNKLKM